MVDRPAATRRTRMAEGGLGTCLAGVLTYFLPVDFKSDPYLVSAFTGLIVAGTMEFRSWLRDRAARKP